MFVESLFCLEFVEFAIAFNLVESRETLKLFASFPAFKCVESSPNPEERSEGDEEEEEEEEEDVAVDGNDVE